MASLGSGKMRRGLGDSTLWLLFRVSPKAAVLGAGGLIALIAFADWRVEKPIPLGFLYLFPMLLTGSARRRWLVGIAAALCTILTEAFDSVAWSFESGIPRDILIFAAFIGMGMFVYEVVRGRRIERDAEEQLKILVDSSPVAIFTADSDGRVLIANDAAHRLFTLEAGTLAGKSIRNYLPALVNVPALEENRQSFRTVMQCRGRREDGEVFLADVWFSTYRTSAGPRLAAMVVDTSEDLRNREELSFHQLLTASRILVGAVSHEIRNVCGAIAVVHENLARNGALAQNQDFEALGTLITALEKIAAMDLREKANQAAGIDLQSLLDELRIIVEPACRDEGVELHWEVEPGLPQVWADRQSLMQVFLNLVKNSERAMQDEKRRELTITAQRDKQRVMVRFRDTGCGVANPERLFRPFQPGAQATGLGLYLSRALLRSFRGELRYERESQGSSFIVELSPSTSADERGEYGDPDTARRRSQPVSGEPQPVVGGRG